MQLVLIFFTCSILSFAQDEPEGIDDEEGDAEVLSEIGADPSLQEIWMSASYPLHTQLIVPRDDLRTQVKLNIAHIVERNYPHLVNRVADSIIRLMSDSAQEETKFATVFHFVGVFKGRHFEPYIENLGHDAWMIALLSSGQASRVLQVADCLSRVPIVPPMESLKQIAILLADGEEQNRNIMARGQLLSDLNSSYLCLLEADEENARFGAVRALSVLAADGPTQFEDMDLQSSHMKCSHLLGTFFKKISGRILTSFCFC